MPVHSKPDQVQDARRRECSLFPDPALPHLDQKFCKRRPCDLFGECACPAGPIVLFPRKIKGAREEQRKISIEGLGHAYRGYRKAPQMEGAKPAWRSGRFAHSDRHDGALRAGSSSISTLFMTGWMARSTTGMHDLSPILLLLMRVVGMRGE